MATSEQANMPRWRQMLSVILLVGGIGLVAASFLAKGDTPGLAVWPQEKAIQYQAASERLHGLSHEFAQQAQRGNELAVRAKLEEAQVEYDALRAQLETAMARPPYAVWLVRVAGLLLAAGGVVGLFLQPSPTSHRNSLHAT